MKLAQYLKGTTQTALANTLGVSQGLVNQWLTGKTKITAERAIDIEKKTNNKITRYDLRPDIFGKSHQERAA